MILVSGHDVVLLLQPLLLGRALLSAHVPWAFSVVPLEDVHSKSVEGPCQAVL